jgi:hypothetical protein
MGRRIVRFEAVPTHEHTTEIVTSVFNRNDMIVFEEFGGLFPIVLLETHVVTDD